MIVAQGLDPNGLKKPRDNDAADESALSRYLGNQLAADGIAGNPVGPPSLVAPPNPLKLAGGVRMNPPASQLAQEGALRPQDGPWSPDNPQPLLDAAGNLMRPSIASPPVIPPANSPSSIAAPLAAPTSQATPKPQAGPLSNGVASLPSLPRTASADATSIQGRPLGYGATVGGVRTFSDGSGGIGAVPATMSPAAMARLAQGDRLRRADGSIGGNIGPEAFSLARPPGAGGGLGNVPELGSAEGLSLARPPNAGNLTAGAKGDNLQAQRFAASDAASIANRDTRSPLGTAARNAAIDAGSSFGTPTSRRLAYGSALENLNGAAASGIKPQADLGIAGVQDAGATQRAGITSAAQLAGDLARNRPNPGAQITLNDGSLGLLGPDGVVRPATDASGKAVKPLQAKDDSATKRSAAIQDQIAKTTAALLGNIVTPGKAATPEQVAQARLTAVQTHGLQTATGPNGQKLVNINGQWQPL